MAATSQNYSIFDGKDRDIEFHDPINNRGDIANPVCWGSQQEGRSIGCKTGSCTLERVVAMLLLAYIHLLVSHRRVKDDAPFRPIKEGGFSGRAST